MDATQGVTVRRAEHLLAPGADARAAGVRRGAVRERIAAAIVRERDVRPFHTQCPAVELIRDKCRSDPSHRRQSAQAHVPGAADRGEPRSSRCSNAPYRPRRPPRRRRPARGARVPLARGPDRQADLRDRGAQHRAGGTAGRVARARTEAATPHPGADVPSAEEIQVNHARPPPATRVERIRAGQGARADLIRPVEQFGDAA